MSNEWTRPRGQKRMIFVQFIWYKARLKQRRKKKKVQDHSLMKMKLIVRIKQNEKLIIDAFLMFLM